MIPGALTATGVILGAWYMLSLVRAVFFGPVKEPHHEGHAIAGPAIIEQADSTTVLVAGQTARPDAYGNLIVTL